jgi:TolB-like protein
MFLEIAKSRCSSETAGLLERLQPSCPQLARTRRPQEAHITEALTVDTIIDLSRYWNIRVMAKDSTDTYRGKSADIRRLGTEPMVSHVVKGTFQRGKDHIRFTAQFIDAAMGVVLWSDRYDRLAGEIFAVQSDVADHIANSIGSREGALEKSPRSVRGANSPLISAPMNPTCWRRTQCIPICPMRA